jgi:hypothetical protein
VISIAAWVMRSHSTEAAGEAAPALWNTWLFPAMPLARFAASVARSGRDAFKLSTGQRSRQERRPGSVSRRAVNR